MKWPFDERPPHFTRDVVQPFSAAIPHCRCVLGASYTETERGGFREKSSVRSRRVELRPIPRGRCCTTGKPAGYCSYFTPSSSLIEQLEIDRSHRMTARAYSPPIWRCVPSVPKAEGIQLRVNARISAIERAKWRHCCNRPSREVAHSLSVALPTESGTQPFVFRALPGKRPGSAG